MGNYNFPDKSRLVSDAVLVAVLGDQRPLLLVEEDRLAIAADKRFGTLAAVVRLEIVLL